jgi:hypothetical protein
METSEISLLEYATKIIDNRTGEILTFENYNNPYVLAYDERGLTIWLTPDRVEKYK